MGFAFVAGFTLAGSTLAGWAGVGFAGAGFVAGLAWAAMDRVAARRRVLLSM
jgi:hypothetical protein